MPTLAPPVIPVVHLISSLSTGGTEMALYKLLRETDQERFPSEVVCLTEPGSVAAKIDALGVPVHDLGMQRGRPNPIAILRFARILRRIRPQVLQTWLYHADLLGLLTGRLLGVPSIVWNIRCSDTDLRYMRGWSGLTVRLLARLSHLPQAVVSNSEAGIGVHRRLGYRPRQWEMIPNGFDLERFRPDPGAYDDVRTELGVGRDAHLVGLVARYDPLKDHETFLRAAALFENPEVHFVLAGKGVDPSNVTLSRLIASLGLGGRVHLLGERSDVPRLTAALDVATCCSTGEGFPNIVGEAMACAVPVVSTTVGDAAIILGDCGLLVPPRDPAALANGWHRLIECPQGERRRMGERARQRVAEHYDAGRIAERYAVLYAGMAA